MPIQPIRHTRLLFALLVFGIATLFCQLCIPYTLMQQESYALFLTTPDYLRETFAAPWPIAHLVGNFLVQFFHFPWVGPLIMGLLTALAYVLLSLPFRRKSFLLFSILVVGLLVVTSVWLTNINKVRAHERLSRVEYASIRHDWKKVLQTATPEATRKDRQLLPYALLALTESGQLPDKMGRYPVRSVDDFCPEQWSDRRGLTFKAILYDCMGVPNEAIHNTFQAATSLSHGTSFGTLRALVRLNRLKGDNLLANKYAAILSHSTLHKGWGGKSEQRSVNSEQIIPSDAKQSSDHSSLLTDHSSNHYSFITNHFITPTYFYNVTSLLAHGVYTKTLADRSLCGLLVQGDLVRFRQMYALLPHAEGEPVPALYREALDVK